MEKFDLFLRLQCKIFYLGFLVNGSPEVSFNSTRGLRQGDHLSPLLFVMVMEAISRMLGRDYLQGFEVGSGGNNVLKVSHLLFVDDTLIFCKADFDQMRYLRMVLFCFKAVSGLKINLLILFTSKLVPVGPMANVEELSEVLGCKISSFPLKYLGLP